MAGKRVDCKFTISRFFRRYVIWLGVSLFGAGLTMVGLRNVFYTHVSSNWPTAIGIIIKSEVEYDSDRSGTVAFARVTYTYSVADTDYTGQGINFDKTSMSSARANEVVKQYPVSRQVMVYYKPENPKICLLEPGLHWRTWVSPGLGFVVLSIGIIACFGVAIRTNETDDDNENHVEVT